MCMHVAIYISWLSKACIITAIFFTLISELSTSIKALQYDFKPEVPQSEGRKLFFDTHAVVRLLEENGSVCFCYTGFFLTYYSALLMDFPH